MNSKYTVSVTLVGYALNLASKNGLSPTELLSGTGITPEALQNPDDFLPYNQYNRIFPEGTRLSKNPFFWLMGVNPKLAKQNSIIWHYCFNARTLQEALKRTKEFYILMNNSVFPEFLFHKEETVIRLVLDSPKIEFLDCQVDYGLSQWFGLSTLFAGPDLKLRSVRLVSTSKERLASYKKYFDVPIQGGCSYNELVFDKGVENLPNTTGNADPDLDLVLSRVLEPALKSMQGLTELETQLFSAIQKELIHGTPPLSRVAARIGITPRTLQRRLEEKGLTFSNLVKKYRHDIAASYLENPEFNVTEVALMVGYHNIAAFSNAFQKWQGLAPSEYRRIHLKQ